MRLSVGFERRSRFCVHDEVSAVVGLEQILDVVEVDPPVIDAVSGAAPFVEAPVARRGGARVQV